MSGSGRTPPPSTAVAIEGATGGSGVGRPSLVMASVGAQLLSEFALTGSRADSTSTLGLAC